MSNELVSTSSKTTSIYDLPVEMAGDLRDAFEDLARGVMWDGRTMSVERLPTPVERKLLVERHRELDPVVRPISYAASAKQMAGGLIADMFKGWPAFKPDAKEESIGHYVMVMQDLPLFAIKEACLDIAQGKVEKLSQYAPPPVPVVYQLAQAKAKRIIEQHATLRRILSTRNVRVEINNTPEQKERIRQGLQQRADEMREQERKIEMEREKELTEKKIAYNRDTILREYRAHNVNPVLFNGQPISMALLKNIEEFKNRPTKRRDENQDLGS